MQNTEIKTGTWWMYLGPGDGSGTKHKVTSVTKDEVTTWSEPTPKETDEIGGWSWLGNHNEFKRNFRQCA
jgi:hypothetical protein